MVLRYDKYSKKNLQVVKITSHSDTRTNPSISLAALGK